MKKASEEPSVEPEEKPGRVWPFFAAFGLIILLIIGIVAYNDYQTTKLQQANQYNGFDFSQAEGGLWVTRIQVGPQPYDIPFYYHPRDTLTVLIDPSSTDPLLKAAPKLVVISVDPDAGSTVVVGAVEVARIVGTKYNLLNYDVMSALSRPADSKVELPVFDCRNATDDVVVLQFIKGTKDVIIRSDKYPNCVLLQYADVNESIRVADRYAYMLLNIMH